MMSQNTYKNRNNESGNVLFYILIAVGLIAALSFAVSSSDRGSMSQIDAERARLAATEMLEYASNVSAAVGQLKLRGCRNNEISFQNSSSTADYTNGNAPGDNTCHIFNIAGGGLSFLDAPDGISNLAESIIFDGNMEIENVGLTAGDATSSELLLVYRDLDQDVCVQMNDLANVENPAGAPPADAGFNFVAFQGTYAHNGVIGDNAAELDGKRSGCANDGGDFHFYRVLIAR